MATERQTEALINNIVGLVEALIQDHISLDRARASTDVEHQADLEERVTQTKETLRRTLEQLLL